MSAAYLPRCARIVVHLDLTDASIPAVECAMPEPDQDARRFRPSGRDMHAPQRGRA